MTNQITYTHLKTEVVYILTEYEDRNWFVTGIGGSCVEIPIRGIYRSSLKTPENLLTQYFLNCIEDMEVETYR